MKQKKKEMACMFFRHPVSKFKKRDFHGSPVARTLSFQHRHFMTVLDDRPTNQISQSKPFKVAEIKQENVL